MKERRVVFTNVGKTAEQIKTTTLKCPHCVWKTHDTERYRAEIELSEHVEFHHKDDDEKDELSTSGLSEYDKVRQENLVRNQLFLESLGFPSERISEIPRAHIPNRRKTEGPVFGERKSLRVTSIVAHTQVEENILLTCPICGVISFRVPHLQAQAWLVKHQETSDACLQIQHGKSLVIDHLITDRKFR